MQQDWTLCAPQMCRYPPSTIDRYLDLPSTQKIQTHTSTRHNTTPPLPTLFQAPYPLPTYTTHTTATKTQTHVQHSPCPHRIGKAQTQFSHPFTPSPPTPLEPNTYTCHTLHQHLSLHPSQARHLYQKKHLNQVYYSYTHSPQPHLPRTPHHITLNTNTPTRVPHTTIQETSSPDITTVSNTLYNPTSWTTQHALSSYHLP